ncbi:MAG: choice-of-anchor X domain-containing protein [Candidatus Sericytochromatia bacterium]|nr:choice-of-anchor X domain-containing protein [Candidatus Sericytochromatia bacterium]
MDGSRILGSRLCLVVAALGLLACQQVPSGNTVPVTEATVSPDDLGETEALGSDEVEVALLAKLLGGASGLEELAGATPLVNDGGAVFLDQTATSYGLASLGSRGPVDRDFERLPRLRVLPMMRKAAGRPDTVTASCDGRARAASDARSHVICLNRGRRTATVVTTERLSGKVAIDLPPYFSGDFAGVGQDDAPEGVGLASRQGVAETRLEFVRRRAGWEVLSVSSTRFVSDDLPAEAPRISWVDGVLGDARRGPEPERFDKLVPKDRFPGLPPNSQIILRVRMSSAVPTLVLVGGLGPSPIRLVDDGTRGDEVPRDGIYSARLPTPPKPRRTFHLSVTAMPASALATESVTTVPEETWVVPFTVK